MNYIKYNDNMNFLTKCLPSCCKKQNNNMEKESNEKEIKKLSLNIELTNQTQTPLQTSLSPKNRFKDLVNNVISLGSFRNNKNKLNNDNFCKICNKELNNEAKKH